MGRFDDLFGVDGDNFDASAFYPGSKQRRGTTPKPREERPFWEEAFDGLTPRVYEIRGEDREFFTIGQLAYALGRKPVTLRKWEADRVIPRATFLAPNPKQDERAKRRLYSRAQAEGIVRIAVEEGLHNGNRKPIGSTEFTARVFELFRELQGK